MSTLFTAHNLKVAGAAFTAVITVAGAFCAATPTPDYNTKWGKLYRLIEILALNFGKAKMTPPTACCTPNTTTDSATTTTVVIPTQETTSK